MKKNLCFILAALWAWGGFITQAGAQGDGWYLTPKLGVSYFTGDNHVKFDSGIGDISKRGHSTRFAGALAIGYDFSDYGAPIRTELEYTTRSSYRTESDRVYPGIVDVPVKSQNKVKIQTLMFNAFLDFETDTSFTPYIGAGLGVAFIKGENTVSSPYNIHRISYDGGVSWTNVNTISTSESERKFAWDLTAGGAWDLTDNLALDLGYRYFNFGKVKTGDYLDAQTSSGQTALHEVMLGLRLSY